MKTKITIKGMQLTHYQNIEIIIDHGTLDADAGRETGKFLTAMYEQIIVEAPDFMSRIKKPFLKLRKMLESFAEELSKC